MKSFKEWVAIDESEKNLHMYHLDELLFLEGVEGTRRAINYLRDFRSMLVTGKSKNRVTFKADGAPALMIFRDPADGKFAIAKKSLFNKVPKFYKSESEIDADLTGELNKKFKLALKYLSELDPPKGYVFQGDLMFTDGDLKQESIDGKDMITMHPNTIVYAIEKGSKLGETVTAAKIGIVFHTVYTGKSFEDMKARFGRKITPMLKSSKNVWAIDANIPDDTSEFMLTDEEAMEVDWALKDIGVQFRQLPAKLLNAIRSDDDLKAFVMTYFNSAVRSNRRFKDGNTAAVGFMEYLDGKFKKEIESKKSVAGKKSTEDKKEKVFRFFHENSLQDISKLFDLSLSLGGLKDILVNKIKKIDGLNHYLLTKDGFKLTNPEGFCAIDSTDGRAIKLVDRFVFSSANFSPDIVKGWAK